MDLTFNMDTNKINSKLKILLNRKPTLRLVIFVLTAFFVGKNNTLASHIRAGEITVERLDDDLTVRIIFTGYRDLGGIDFFLTGTINLGDGTELDINDPKVEKDPEVQITSTIGQRIFTLVHSYNGDGNYKISYTERDRNEGIANMTNSGDTPFHVETWISIDRKLDRLDENMKSNSSPVFLVPPVDMALVGTPFLHQPGAYDADGDSLVYKISIPLQAAGSTVLNYKFPNENEFYTSYSQGNAAGNDIPTFEIDEETGLITWDAPGDVLDLSSADCPIGFDKCAEYNVAFIVEEWKNINGRAYNLGYVMRDMQITVVEGDNEPPEVEVDSPICVEARQTAEALVVASDPDGDQVKIEMFGAPLENDLDNIRIGREITSTSDLIIDANLITDKLSDYGIEPAKYDTLYEDEVLREKVWNDLFLNCKTQTPIELDTDLLDQIRSNSITITCYDTAFQRVGSFQNTPSQLKFQWTTGCPFVQDNPHEIIFKVTDNPPPNENGFSEPPLTDFATLDIYVLGPSPVGLSLSANSARSINLSWDKYSCTNADEMELWRRVGAYSYEPGDCDSGIPANSEYELIQTLDINQLSFIDDNDGKGLNPGANYCYRLVAKYPGPGNGVSYASTEVCFTIEADGPVVTNVDIEKTHPTDGDVNIIWTPPYEIDPLQFPGPYKYGLLRQVGTVFDDDETFEVVEPSTYDTAYLDTGLNTLENPYVYKILLYDNQNNYIDSSGSASTVRLEIDANLNSLELDWNAEVPWSNLVQQYPWHLVYRNYVDPDDQERMVLIDSTDVTNQGLYYKDDGSIVTLEEDTEYCYAITTRGSYGNSPTLPEPLINRSQMICSELADLIPPCDPLGLTANDNLDCESRIAEFDCNVNIFQNSLDWEDDLSFGCEEETDIYHVYYSQSGNEEDYELIAQVSESEYIHPNLQSLKGCYRISALDVHGNESGLTEAICLDNCPNYLLPNIFTPNGDGANEQFGAFYSDNANQINDFDNSNCPRFVKDVVFKVYDRNGREVYKYESSDSENGILINWDGRNSNGFLLPSGVYFYLAQVTFDRLDPNNSVNNIKGWVRLIR